MSDVERFAGGAVDATMGVIEAGADFLDDVNNLIDGELQAALFHLVQDLAKVAPFDVIHD